MVVAARATFANDMQSTGMKRAFASCSLALGAFFCLPQVHAGACDQHTFHSIEEACAADHACVDTLIIADVDSFPDLCDFPNLKFLWIRNHTINSISPKQLECLGELEVLKVNYGLLRTFSIGDACPKLRELSLAQNELDSIVGPFDQLAHLRILQLSDNPVKYVDIGQILKLKRLTRLGLSCAPGDAPWFDAEQQAEIARVLSHCTLWFGPSWPYIRPTSAEQK
jgi:hypothetical protein